MCDEYTTIFSKYPTDVGKTNLVQMSLIPKNNINKPLDQNHTHYHYNIIPS